MRKRSGFRAVPLTFNRQMVAAVSAINKKQNTIHAILEVEITTPRGIIREYRERTGESLSFTAYVVTCLAQAVAEHPRLNSFRKGKSLILLDDVTISVLVERDFQGENAPDSFPIAQAQAKTYRQIHDEIRSAQRSKPDRLGSQTGMAWIRFIPVFLLRLFVRIAAQNISMAKRYGKIGVTAVGMFSQDSSWFIPLSSATVLVTVGGIHKKVVFVEGHPEEREHLCLTLSFDHDLVDGAPAARFAKTFTDFIESGKVLQGGFGNDKAGPGDSPNH